MDLTVVLFGNTSAVQFHQHNFLLGETEPNIEDVAIPRRIPFHLKSFGCCVSVINLIGLQERTLNLDDLSGQLLIENEIVAFVFVVRLSQLTDTDEEGIKWLQTVFDDGVFPFLMILFTYESEEGSDSLDDLKNNPALERLIKTYDGRYHTCSKKMNIRSELIQ
ncbi:hypothetical protein DNTS_029373 [Danionella cerebrum]|uniref:AIG1-type G domain-containing protein n=1 Tax=Danionella cerebrum TaxID=2873325 RepID=A0A553N5G8_9TELE|nr:hypothetical protein DNTS_029373 [Danionella translucida]